MPVKIPTEAEEEILVKLYYKGLVDLLNKKKSRSGTLGVIFERNPSGILFEII